MVTGGIYFNVAVIYRHISLSLFHTLPRFPGSSGDPRVEEGSPEHQDGILIGEKVSGVAMIRAVIVMSTQGKPRLTRFYDYQSPERQQELIRSVYGVLCGRAENVSNFVQTEAIFGPDTRMVYKHYATLYFVFVFDSSENELAMLDLIQVFVETLDKCFKNVCELDIVFNFNKMHTILDEIVVGGQVLETSSDEVLKAVEEITKLEKSTNAVGPVPKSFIGKLAR